LNNGTEKLIPIMELEHRKCSFIAILKFGPLTISNANERLAWTLTATELTINNLLDSFVGKHQYFKTSPKTFQNLMCTLLSCI